jgi:hypothetical protein
VFRNGNLNLSKLFEETDSVHPAFICSAVHYPPEVGLSRAIYEIRFVEKTLRFTAWELVTYLLGNTPDGNSWRMTYYDAIRLVEEGKAHFYIMRAGLPIELIVVNNAWGYKCLRATDDATSEVLLSLPTPSE